MIKEDISTGPYSFPQPDYGEKGSKTKPAIDKAAEMGVHLVPCSIAGIRNGSRPGTETDFFMDLGLVRSTNDASRKNLFYREVFGYLVDFRSTQRQSPYRYKMKGLTRDVANYLGITPANIGSILNNGRNDFLSDETREYSEFDSVMDDFWRKHTDLDGSRSAHHWIAIQKEWEGTPRSFYTLLGRLTTANGQNNLLSTFVPYEAQFLLKHYLGKINQGTQAFSPYDNELTSAVKIETGGGKTRNVVDYETLAAVINNLPILINRITAIGHLKALAFGDVRPLYNHNKEIIDDFI